MNECNLSCKSNWNLITDFGDHKDGIVITPQGVVGIYADDNITTLHFAYKSRYYARIFHKGYTQRGIVTKAGRFAREIVKKADKPKQLNLFEDLK